MSVPLEFSLPLFRPCGLFCTGDFSEPELSLVPGVPTPAAGPPRADSEVVPQQHRTPSDDIHRQWERQTLGSDQPWDVGLVSYFRIEENTV